MNRSAEPGSSSVDSLRTDIDCIRRALAECRADPAFDSADVSQLRRIELAVQAAEWVGTRGSHHVRSDAVSRVVADVSELAVALEVGASRERLEIASILGDRLMHSTLRATAPDVSGEHSLPVDAKRHHSGSQSSDPSPGSQSLNDLVLAYGGDAERERGTMAMLYGVGLALLLGGVAIALLGIFSARDERGLQFAEFAAFGLTGALLLAGAAVAIRQAVRHRRAAYEATRLQRQLTGLDVVLLPIPDGARDLMRGALVQRLFPSSVEDNEPWREPSWPSSDALLEAMFAEGPLGSDDNESGDQSPDT